MVRKNVIFVGGVQTAGFRSQAYELAKELQLTGWVANLSDGSIEVEVQGREHLVNLFISRLMKQNHIHITNRLIEDKIVQFNEKDFVILW